jgi:glycosyltransferase involved in cell wall biosynthesis
MKIMIVTPYFYPKVGGLENYALNIAKGLKNDYGHEIFVVTSNHKENKYIEEKVEGLKVIRLPALFKFSNTPLNPMWYWQLRKIIKIEKPDLINVHSPVPGLADIAIRAARKTPTVLTYHAATLKKDGSLIFNVVARLYENIQLSTFKRVSSIIAVSEYVKETLPKKYHPKISVVCNAINLEDIPKTKINHKNNQLIFIGHLEQTHAWKGLGDILTAVSILKKTTPDVKLLVIGDGNMLDDYRSQVRRLGLIKNVKFCGNINGLKKYELIRSSTLMTIYPTSSNDAFPTVLLEAWACQTPVLAADIGALSTLIHNNVNGFLVEPTKPAALAEKLSKLLDNTNLKAVAENAHVQIFTRYTWKISVKATEELFEKLNSNKSVLYIVNFPINNKLAPSIHVFEICNNLMQLGMSVCLISPRIEIKDGVQFKFKNLRTPKILFPITYQIHLFFSLLRYCIVSRPNVLYVRQEAFMIAPSMIARLMRIPMIVEVNGLIENEVMADKRLPFKYFFKKTRFFYYVEKRAYKVAEKVITVTDGLSKRLSKKYNIPKEKLIVIENGVNLEELKPTFSENHIYDSTIGYIGSLSAWQGLKYIIQAMPKIILEIPAARLIIYGEGQEELSLHNLVKELQVTKYVKFKGPVDHSEVNALINSFTICTAFYTKDREGLNSPFKVYEYLACGKPVITSSIQGIGDKFASVSVVANAEDVDDFAKKALSLLKDGEQRRILSSKARDYIVRGHSWNNVASNVARVIGDIQ